MQKECLVSQLLAQKQNISHRIGQLMIANDFMNNRVLISKERYDLLFQIKHQTEA